MGKKRTIDDLTNNLVDTINNIFDWWVIDATNKASGGTREAKGLPKGYHNFDHEKLQKIFDMGLPLIKDAQMTKRLEAKSMSQVVDMVKTGQISVKDGKDIMEFMKAKLDVEERKLNVKLQKEIAESIKDDLKDNG
jgi:DNA-binding ferritin-like protein (Dps family)